MSVEKAKASDEQLAYASLLEKIATAAFAIIVITFFIYVFGFLPNVVDMTTLQQVWKLPASDYIAQTHSATGWHWVTMLGKSEPLNNVGIALLSGATIIAYLSIIPAYLRKKDTAFLVITIIEVAVLILAASGILTAGGH